MTKDHTLELSVDMQPGEAFPDKSKISDGDEALNFLKREEVGGEVNEVDQKKLLRKIDFMVVPLMFLCYCMQVRAEGLSECRRGAECMSLIRLCL